MPKSEQTPMIVGSRVYRTGKNVHVVVTVEDTAGRKVVPIDLGEIPGRVLRPSHVLAALAAIPAGGPGLEK